MNKLSIVFAILLGTMARADELSDAIRASDYEKVTKIVAERNNRAEPKALSATEREKYLAVAKEVVDLRKTQLLAPIGSVADRSNVNLSTEGLLLLTSITLPFLYMYLDTAQIIDGGLGGFGISVAASFLCFAFATGSMETKINKHLQNLYDNSLKNYEVIHDQGV